VFYPQDTILQKYFDRSNVIIYGIGPDAIASKYSIGVYVKFQRYSFEVIDSFAMGYVVPISGTWITMGIEKIIPTSFVDFYGRIGGTLHYDSYDIFMNYIRLCFQPSLGFRLDMIKYIKPFFEINYEYGKLSVRYYENVAYTRHQAYLAAKNFQTGGVLLKAGVSCNLIN